MRELRRDARGPVVVLTWDRRHVNDSWLTRDYLPSFTELTRSGHDLADLVAALDGARIEPIPIPDDCQDGFLHAYWRRPHAYLDRRSEPRLGVLAAEP